MQISPAPVTKTNELRCRNIISTSMPASGQRVDKLDYSFTRTSTNRTVRETRQRVSLSLPDKNHEKPVISSIKGLNGAYIYMVSVRKV